MERDRARERERDNRLDTLLPSLTMRIPQSQKSNATITCKPQYKLISWQTYWSRNQCHNDVIIDANKTLKVEWWWRINCLAESSQIIYLPKSCCISNQVELSPCHEYLPKTLVELSFARTEPFSPCFISYQAQ